MDIDETLYTEGELEELYKAKADGLDYSLFADPDFNEHQMFELRNCLMVGYDISSFAYPRCPWMAMNALRWAMDLKLDPSLLVDAFNKLKRFKDMEYLIRVMVDVKRSYEIDD